MKVGDVIRERTWAGLLKIRADDPPLQNYLVVEKIVVPNTGDMFRINTVYWKALGKAGYVNIPDSTAWSYEVIVEGKV